MLVAGDEHDLSSKTSPELYKGCLAVGPPGRWDLIARKDNFFGLLDSIGLTQPTDRRGTRRWWARTGRRSGPACCEASKRIGFLVFSKRSKSRGSFARHRNRLECGRGLGAHVQARGLSSTLGGRPHRPERRLRSRRWYRRGKGYKWRVGSIV